MSGGARIAFRADGGDTIGRGHVMRCLALADTLCERGAECVFLHRDRPGHMADVIDARGHGLRLLPASPSDVTGSFVEAVPEDIFQTCRVLRELSPHALVVDHYGLGGEWENAVRNEVSRVLAIDDLADREHPCDLLLDPNRPSQSRPSMETPESSRILSGPRYAPLAAAHRRRRPTNRPRRGPASQVLVSYGGVDPNDELARALRVLGQPAFRHLTVDAVAPSDRYARAHVSTRPGLRVLPPQGDLAEFMARADLALGAGGSASWERCAAGLPSVITALAENQLVPVRVLEAAGAGLFAGMTGSVSDADLAFALSLLLDDTALFRAISERAWRLTDAEGARRVAAALVPDPPDALALRPVGPDDMLLLYHWANDPATRRNAIDQRTIRWDEHVRWFERKHATAATRFDLLVAPDGLRVGQLRIEPEGEAAGIINFSVEPALRGQGYGRRLIQLAVLAWQDTGRGGPLLADVRAVNQPSRRAFAASGFRIEREIQDDILRYRLDPGQAGR